MKILTLCTDYLPNIGGITNHIYFLNKYLLKKGVDAKILHIVENSDKKHLFFEKYSNEDNIAYKLHIKDDLSKLNKLKYRKIILKIIEKYFPDTDIIHTHEFKNTEFLIPHGYRWVWTNHSSNFFKFITNPSFKDKIISPYLKYKLSKANNIITVSTLFYNKTHEFLHTDNISMIPNGIEIEHYINSQDVFEFPKNKIKILIPARWSKVKGIHLVMELMERLQNNNESSNLLFIFAGNDSYDDEGYYQKLKNKVKKFENKILLGKVRQEEMPSLYKAIDIVLIPSLFESASIVSLEAMSAKKIIIASNTGGIPELVKNNERGFIFEKENIDDLKLKILYVVSKLESEELDRMKESAYIFVAKNYNWSKIADKTINIYMKTLK
jgi:glycosyltransferase involved in cell wall biosynthesis